MDRDEVAEALLAAIGRASKSEEVWAAGAALAYAEAWSILNAAPRRGARSTGERA